MSIYLNDEDFLKHEFVIGSTATAACRNFTRTMTIENGKNDIMDGERKRRNHFLLVDMIEKGVPYEEIAEKCGEGSCVGNYKLQVPEWCHEDADCYKCWVKCLSKYFGG